MKPRGRTSGAGDRLVHSTDRGRLCPECRRPVADCACRRAPAAPRTAPNGPVRVGRQTQGRAGRGVTVVTGLPLAGAALDTLARELKQLCGSGGTVRDGVVEIQGEHRDRLVAELLRRGFPARRAGG